MTDCPAFLGSYKAYLGQQNIHWDVRLVPGLGAIVGQNHTPVFTDSYQAITRSDYTEQITFFWMNDHNTWLLEYFGDWKHFCVAQLSSTTQHERRRDSSNFLIKHTIHRCKSDREAAA